MKKTTSKIKDTLENSVTDLFISLFEGDLLIFKEGERQAEHHCSVKASVSNELTAPVEVVGVETNTLLANGLVGAYRLNGV